MTTRKTDAAPGPRPHTELRRPGAAAKGPEPDPGLKPRTPPERLAETLEDGADDLFNDLPV